MNVNVYLSFRAVSEKALFMWRSWKATSLNQNYLYKTESISAHAYSCGRQPFGVLLTVRSCRVKEITVLLVFKIVALRIYW